MSERIVQNADYVAAQDKIKATLSDFAAGVHTDPNAVPMRLHPEAVFIEGAPRQTTSFVERLDDSYRHGDKRERLDVTVNFNPTNDNAASDVTAGTDLRAMQEGQLRKAALSAFQQMLSKVPAKDGGTVADRIDFSGEPAEASKPRKEQLADAKKLVEKGVAEAGDKIPPEVAALLTHAKTFDTEASTVFGFGSARPDVTGGHVETSFAVSSKNESEVSNAAVSAANIEARRDEILAAVKEAAVAAHTHATPEELATFKADLDKLDLKVETRASEFGGNVVVRLGNRLDAPAQGAPAPEGEKSVGKTALATLSEDTLAQVVNDAVLFKGKDAANVAHLLAGDNDVERLLARYKDASPALAEALKSDVLVNALPWNEAEKEREKMEKTAKIVPSVTVDTSEGNDGPNNKLRIHLDLPEGVTHSEVVRALAGKTVTVAPAATPQEAAVGDAPKAPLLTEQPPVGPATQRVAEQRAAANDQGMSQGAA